jgi:hypothetical protein
MSDVPTNPVARPSRAGPLLDLLRKLIDYGTQLAANFRQHGLGPNPSFTARPFGTPHLPLILARIARGLLRASALQARLIRNGARLDAPRRTRNPGRRSAPDVAARQSPHGTDTCRPTRTAIDADQDDSLLAQLPTPEQIAAEIRSRPIGAVIADICRDLGILPNHPLWRDLSTAIMVHGGNLAALLKDIFRRLFQNRAAEWPSDTLPTLPAALLSLATSLGTGPP